ncbi:MAG: immunoglobulin domain-containing protein [Opitutales bacterium]|nr:immunoglobulin domain-containing protein [Opitutales bacterium]
MPSLFPVARIANALPLIFFLAILNKAPAAPDSVETAFAGTAGTVYGDAEGDFGSVASILVQPDGKILVGSNEMATTLPASGGGFIQAPLIRFNPDGSVDNTFFADANEVGEGFGIVYIGQGWPEVMALGLQSDGKIIAGGVMTGMNDGTNNVISRNIVRIHPDGTVDPTFQTAGTYPWLSGGNVNYINHLIVEPNDKIVISGGFQGLRAPGSQPFEYTTRQGVARLNADGSLDTSFALDTREFGIPEANAPFVRVLIFQVERDSAGRYYVVGEISGFGLPVPVFARLFPNGRRDFSFAPDLPAAAWNSVAVDREGRITVTGIPAFNSTVAYRLFPDGSLDPSFTGPSIGFYQAQPLQFDSAGRFLLTASNQLRRVLADGSIDPTFTGNATWSGWTTTPSWNLATTAPDGRIYAGGFFNRVNGEQPVKFVRFEGNAVANALVLDATAVSIVENAGTLYLSVSRLGDGIGAASVDFATANGSALAGADFTATSGTLSWADGETGPKFLPVALIDNAVADGDKAFSVNFSGATGAPISGPTSTAVTILDDEALPVITTQPLSQSVKERNNATLTVGVTAPVPVSFQWFKDGVLIPGATSSSLLLISATESTAGDYTVEITGNGDSVLSDPATITVIPAETVVDPDYVVTGFDSSLSAVALPGGGLLAVTGSFINGYALTRYDADGVAVASEPITYSLTGTYSTPSFRLHPAPDGTFLLSGRFGVINGVAQPRLVRFNADLTLDLSFNANIGVGNVPLSGVTVTPSGAIYLSIRLQSPWLGLARLQSDGSVDPTFSSTLTNSSFGFLDAVYELPDGGILVGHNSGPGTNTFGLAKLSPDGSPFPGFNANNSLSPRPQHFLHLPDGRFYVARNTILERRLPNGDLDPTFVLGGGFSGNITGIHFQRGRIVVTGPTAFAGEPIPGIARFSLDGVFDDNFPGGTGPNTAFNSQVSSALIDSDDSLIVRGGFSTWNGVARAGIARLLLAANEAGFSTLSATAFENEGTLTIEVLRYGDTSDAASVRVTSVDGSATSPNNFLAIDAVLTWVPGDASPKTVTVTLVDDALVNGDRTFTLVLSDATGLSAIANPVTLTLRDDDSLPQITSQPQDVDVPPGFAASFTVTVSSPTAVTYQWFKDGVAISGATAATYTIASAAAANEGIYTVRVTNAYDSVLSAPATLTIIPPPAAVADVFTGTPAFTSNVLALANAPGGAVYVGGEFTNYDSTGRNYLVKINEDGSLDTDFTPPFLNARVRHITVQPDGKLLVAGDFSQVDGTSRNRGLLRLNADGSEDTAFSTNTGSGGNGNGYATDILPDGRIVFGGTFTSWNGTSLGSNRYLIRLNTDGTFDGAYAEPSTNHILAVRALPDGSVLASNNTTSSSAVKVSRFLPDRSRDTTFFYASGRTRVDAIALDPDGNYIFAGASSTRRTSPDQTLSQLFGSGPQMAVQVQLNGKVILGGSPLPRITRFLPDNALDPFFVLSANPNGNVNALALRPDGKFWAGGAFTTINGRTVNRLVLLNGDIVKLAFTAQPAALTIVDPGEDMTLTVGATGNTAISYQWFQDGEPLSDGPGISGSQTAELSLTDVASTASGTYTVVITNESGSETSKPAQVIVLGVPQILSLSGDVSMLEGGPLTLEVEALGAGTLTYQWFRDGTLLPGQTSATLNIAPTSVSNAGAYTVEVSNLLGFILSDPITVDITPNEAAVAPGWTSPTVDAIVYQILPLSDGRALVGGNFNAISDGVNTSGERLAVVNEDGSVVPVPGIAATGGAVRAISRQADGKILLGGSFTAVHGEPRNRVARLNADLTLDTTFVPPTGSVSGTVRDVREEASGSIMVVGEFWQFGDLPNSGYAVRLTSTGAHDTSFTSTANSLTTFVRPQADNSLVLGGWFSNWAGISGASYLIQVNNEGSALAGGPFSVGFFAIRAGTQLANGDLIISQDFGSAVRRYALSGSLVQSFTADNGTFTFAETADGSILFGGLFTTFNGVARPRIARVFSDGTNDLTFDPGTGFNQAVETIAIAPSGGIWVGGNFTTYNDAPAQRLTFLKGTLSETSDPDPDPDPTPAEALAAYLAAAGVPENLRGPADDATGDGIPNLVKWVYGLNPIEPATGFTVFSPLVPEDGTSLNTLTGGSAFDPAERYLTFTVLLPDDSKGTILTVQTATDLTNFETSPLGLIQVGAPVPVEPGFSLYVYACTLPMSSAPSAFLRMKIDFHQ